MRDIIRNAPILLPALAAAVALEGGCSRYTLGTAPSDPPTAQAYVVVPPATDEGESTLARYARLPYGSEVQLDGSQSFHEVATGQSTEGLTYEWSILLTPEGSGIALSDPLVAMPTFTPDIAGTYEFELVVVDDDDLVSPPSIATVIAAAPENLTITMTWTTGATDVDVHLIRPGGAYWSEDDCYFGNPEPDWGVVGSVVDNPVLNRDDDDGGDVANPAVEEVVVQRPEDGDYEVVVTYHNDRGNDFTVQPSLTIAVGSTIIGNAGPVELGAEGDAWRAVRIRWPEMQVEPIDEMTTHTALGGPDYNEGS